MVRLKKIFFAFTKGERIVFIVASAVAIASFIVVMEITIARATIVVPAAGGEYTEGMIGQPEYVNPVTASTQADLALVKLAYSNIYDIADSVSVSPDGRTWTVHLKENLHWQDGEKITSDDVVFTVQSIENPDANSPLAQSWQGVAVERASELEVQFSLANPYAFFPDTLHDLYILPKHIFANTPPGNWRLSDYNLKPIGSGPYEFVSYDKRSDGTISAYHLQRWDNYFNAKPLISNFNFAFFANVNDLVHSFNAGTVDGFGGIATQDLAAIGRPYDLSSWRTPSYYAVFWNQSKNLALQNNSVRQALALAVDRDMLVRDILGGQGKPEYGPIPPDAPYFIDATATPPSLDAASSTLSAAGWTLGEGGMRTKTIQKTAVPLGVTLTVPDLPFLVQTAEVLRDTWAQLGVTTTIATSSPNDIVNGAIKNRDYDALLFGNILGPSSDLYAFWDSSQRFSPGLNLSIYQNKSVDTLVENARSEMDSTKRTQDFVNAQTDIRSDDPALFLYSTNYLYVTAKGVNGIAPKFLADPSDRFLEVGAWYLNTARVLK